MRCLDDSDGIVDRSGQRGPPAALSRLGLTRDRILDALGGEL